MAVSVCARLRLVLHHLSAHFGVYLNIKKLNVDCVYMAVISQGFPLHLSRFLSMALVVMCGQPCSGKSAAAACLAAALRTFSTDLIVRIIDESSLHLGRNDSYKGALTMHFYLCY